MPNDKSNIAIAVDAELMVLERRVAKLKEIRRLALELDGTRLPASAVEPAPRARLRARPKPAKRSRHPRLTVEDALETVRDLLADGPTTVREVHTALGRFPSAHSKRAIEAALEQLGAVPAGKRRGGATVYKRRQEADGAATAPPAAAELDRQELELRIADLAERALGWSAEEYAYQLRKRCGLEASAEAVAEVLAAMNGDRP